MNRRRKRPLYFRLLRVRHLTVRPTTLFLLFEGSITLALLLYLADVVDEWGILAIPVVVAIMVKLNDSVAGALIRPLALAQLRTPRPSEEPAVGRSPVARPSYPTSWIDLDDAQPSDAARPSPGDDPVSSLAGPGVARGVAPVPDANLVETRRRPAPGVPADERAPDWEPGEAEYLEVGEPDEGLDLGDEPVRPDGGDRFNRGNTGRFSH
jgi:hypothetical protein